MSIAVVAHNYSKGINNATTSGVDTTGSTLLVVGLSLYGPGLGGGLTISDSYSNTWTALTSRTQNISYVRFWYCANPIVGSGHTFSFSGGGDIFASIAAAGFSGVTTTSPFDTESGAGSDTNVVSPGSVSPANAGSLALTLCSIIDNGTTASVDSGYSIIDQQAWDGSTAEGFCWAWKEISSASNPQFTVSGGVSDAAAIIAVFKPGAGGGSTRVNRLACLGVG